MICIKCGTDKVRIKTGIKYGRGYKKVGADGRIWNGRICPDCVVTAVRERRHQLGLNKPVSELTDCNIATGRRYENLVAEYFRERGMRVEQTTGKGPDIIANGLKVEVKSMRRVCNRFYCNPVEKSRVNDDLIALVMGDTIVIETMEEHLAACTPKGNRGVDKSFFGL